MGHLRQEAECGPQWMHHRELVLVLQVVGELVAIHYKLGSTCAALAWNFSLLDAVVKMHLTVAESNNALDSHL